MKTMKKMITLLAVTVSVLILALAQAAPIVTPGDGYQGPYRIAFVTIGKTNAQSGDIADYNAFVTTAATNVPYLDALGTTWKCIGSTTNDCARTNTQTYTVALDGAAYDSALDVPIYTTDGNRIADDNADLWDGDIQSPIYYEDGTQPWTVVGQGELAWTGTQDDGTPCDGSGGDPTVPLGGLGALVNIGEVRGGYVDSNWIEGPNANWAGSRSLMAMSAVIPAPPPGTVIIIR